jgi:hypothetical protein
MCTLSVGLFSPDLSLSIPFIEIVIIDTLFVLYALCRGTYLQDITAVNEVKDDMKDGKVNLTKMIQIAKSASSVINCNLLAPKIVFDPKISNLIIKIPVLSEDVSFSSFFCFLSGKPSGHND